MKDSHVEMAMVDPGLDPDPQDRPSWIGYGATTYKKNMDMDLFTRIRTRPADPFLILNYTASVSI